MKSYLPAILIVFTLAAIVNYIRFPNPAGDPAIWLASAVGFAIPPLLIGAVVAFFFKNSRPTAFSVAACGMAAITLAGIVGST